MGDERRSDGCRPMLCIVDEGPQLLRSNAARMVLGMILAMVLGILGMQGMDGPVD